MSAQRSRTGTTALGAVGVSALGLATTTVGVLMNADGFQSKSDHQTALSDTCFLAFVLGGLAALVLALVVLFRHREARTAKAVGLYLVAAVVIVVVVNLVNPNG